MDDSYRYALDAAGFDFLGVCDHQGGGLIPYHWWRMQKAVDLYTIKNRFAPLYSYERSLRWPNGHRNVLFGFRGRPILAIADEEMRGAVNSGDRLYPYLRQYNGISTPHTSGTGDGTDWRDSNAALEPFVEIYQGYRNSYEGPGMPRAPSPQEAKRFAAGFVWNAWAKGLRLGVQSSSDHVSTHVSNGGVYVERVDRESILAGMRARHSYAATDNIFVETRMADHFMSDSFSTAAGGATPLSVYVSGTAPLARIEVIKNNTVVYSVSDGRMEERFTYTDRDAKPGTAYYYVRIQQEDGQLCWSSPIWVEYR